MKFYIFVFLFLVNVGLFAQSSDPVFDFPQTNYEIYAMALSEDGSTLYIGGYFTSITGPNGTFTRNHLAAIDVTTGNITSWNPGVTGTGAYVNCIAVSGNDIYVSGYFLTVGGASRNYLAKLNALNNTADASWIPDPDWYIFHIEISGNDIYVSGYFDYIGGSTHSNIARLNNSNGAADGTFITPTINNTIRTFALGSDGIYIGGAFEIIGGETRNYVAKLNYDGSLNSTWNPNASDPVYCMAHSGNYVYVGGEFSSIGGETRNCIARLNNTNGTADYWNPSPSSSSVTRVFDILTEGNNVYFAGSFGGFFYDRFNVAKYDIDGNKLSWNPIFNEESTVYSLVKTNSRIIAGGYYSKINNLNYNNLAAFDIENPGIPSLPEWGLILFGLLTATLGGWIIWRRI